MYYVVKVLEVYSMAIVTWKPTQKQTDAILNRILDLVNLYIQILFHFTNAHLCSTFCANQLILRVRLACIVSKNKMVNIAQKQVVYVFKIIIIDRVVIELHTPNWL